MNLHPLHKSIVIFLLQTIFLYIILMIVISLNHQTLQDSYVNFGNSIFKEKWEEVMIRFQVLPEEFRSKDNNIALEVDTRIDLINRNALNQALAQGAQSLPMGYLDTNSRYEGFMPLLFFIVVAVSLPFRWWDRLLTLLAGIPIMSFLVYLWVYMSIMMAWRTQTDVVGVLPLSEGGTEMSVIRWLHTSIQPYEIEFVYLMPLLIALIVSTMSGALNRFINDKTL